ncbi:MAG: dihydroxy-acid dehydratase [Synergistaceae bacterium]|jgi:dihydroxy-acid dehydratase|nr:dihydroxy-acid dehydratase [Synergistaceae bacterium]
MNEVNQPTIYRTKPTEMSLGKSLYMSMGFSAEEIAKPIIGIANSWTNLVSGHYNLRQVAEYIRNGIYRGDCTAVEFGVIAACDGLANGHEGMKYILPSRELITASIETQVRAHALDGIVLLASCDKIVPGMLMAAARLDIPAILVNGGPMLGGIEFDGREADGTSADEAYAMYVDGKINKEQLESIERNACFGCGSCSFFGTANTMCCLTEVLGMSLPGSALLPAVSGARMEAAYRSGKKICELVKNRVTTRDIITDGSIRNAVRACIAMSGSTNAVLHLPAIAREADLTIDVLREFEISGDLIPQICRVNPASKWNMIDFWKAGGVPRVLSNLANFIDESVMTCTGRTIKENLETYVYEFPDNPELIRTIDDPFDTEGGIAVLRGNLSPGAAVTKPGAFAKEMQVFRGKAVCFNSEEEANVAILAGQIEPGNVIVIRYEGPKGGPGMREMYKAMKYLYGMGLNTSTALITDGRFSGTNNGCFVGHICPEAAEGGTLAIVRDGDIIEIDIPERKLTLCLDDREIAERLSSWVPPKKEIRRGWLQVFSEMASSVEEGVIFK